MDILPLIMLSFPQASNKSKVEVHSMKKIVFGIALILFGFSMAYISVQAEWGIMQVVSVLSVFSGLIFSIFGFIEREK